MKVTKHTGKSIAFPQMRGSVASLKYPVIADVKYDGEFNYIHITDTEAFTINKYGTMRRDFPELNKIAKLVREATSSVTLVCEVYWDEGKLGALYDLLSHKKDDDIKLRAFDLIEVGNENYKAQTFLDRREMMYELGLKRWLPTCWMIEDKIELQHMFENVTNQGYEGLAVKGLDTHFVTGPCAWVKMKYKDRTDYAVCSIDPVKERIGIAAPSSTVTPGVIQMIEVGCKAPNKYKKHIKIGEIVTIEHQGVLASGSLRHPVLIAKKEWV
jgi:ATP-dependent DNA ligase